MQRYLFTIIDELVESKFLFIAGPRQVGKTTLAKSWLETKAPSQYLNWDIPEDRKIILRKDYLSKERGRVTYVILDEIHKYKKWKSYIKGVFDRASSYLRIIVTGSARLDIFQKRGDSLFGRYELLRLHPLSMGELVHGTICEPPQNWLTLSRPSIVESTLWNKLETFSSFPEPYLKQDSLFYQRWESRRRELLVREDLRDISDVKNLSLVEHLYLLLPERVGSLLSINALKEELGVAFDTVKNWLKLLEQLYICFRLRPYSRKMSRSLKKEQKLYLWNWVEINDEGAKFENMVASHLLKSIHAWNDIGYGRFELNYWRNKEKKEVDFIVTNKGIPLVAIECKLHDQALASHLVDFEKHYGKPITKIQLIKKQGIDIKLANARIVSADKFLAALI